VIAGVVLLGLSVFGPSASAANNPLSGWTEQGGDANWAVQSGGDTVYVVAPNPDFPTANGPASFFVSPFNAGGTFKVNITPNTEPDDDYIGFAVGYTAPVNNEVCSNDDTCDTGFILFDWKKATEVEGGDPLPAEEGGQEGFSLMKVAGARDLQNNNTAQHPNCFWTHEDVANFCDVLGTDYGFGKGYSFGVTYSFQVTATTTQLKIVLLGTGGNANRTIFDVAPPGGTTFSAGRLAFYNYSQPNVEYGFDNGTVQATTTTTGAVPTTTAVTPTTTAGGGTATTSSPTVGPPLRSTLERTGPNSLATAVELFGGVALVLGGALMAAARGRRPDGAYYA
jgi:hypothetical protein